MSKTVFISHSEFDAEIGEQIESVIQEGGFRSWRFQRDVQGGKSWQLQLPARIKEHQIFLYIATAYAQLSENCQRELQHAAILGKRLVTITTHPRWIPPSPLDGHQAVYYDGTGKAVARLMEALQGAERLDRDRIPKDWKTWDGRTRQDLANSGDLEHSAESEGIRRNLNVVEKREILQLAVPKMRSYFANALGILDRSDSRIEYRIDYDTNAGFTCFIFNDGDLIKGCRIFISAGFSGITYDGSTLSALQWEVEEIRSQIDQAEGQINENLQAVYDGSADAAALVRSFDVQIESLQSQLRDRIDFLSQRGNNLRFFERDDSYKIQTTAALLDAEPVLEFLPSPTLPVNISASNISTIAEAAKTLAQAFIGDLSI